MEILRRLAALFGNRSEPLGSEQPDNPFGSFQKLPEASDLPTDTEVQRIVRQICEEAIARAEGWQVKLSDSARWNALKKESEELQIAVMLTAAYQRPQGSVAYVGNSWQVQSLRNAIVSQTLRRHLNFNEDQLVSLLNSWLAQGWLEYGLPGKTILGAVERYAESLPLSAAMKRVLGKIRERALRTTYPGQAPNKFALGVADRIDKLLDPSSVTEKALPAGPFATQLNQRILALPAGNHMQWLALSILASEAGDKSKPSVKWLSSAKSLIDEVGSTEVSIEISNLLDQTTPDPQRPDNSLDILKGFIWASTLLNHAEQAGQVGRFAEKCFRKISGVGARSVKLGNAALWALSEMAGEPRAAAELFRLREKVKYPSARKVIDNRVSELATKAGSSVEELEDRSLPHFGLSPEGNAVFPFGDARAEIQLRSTELELQWFGASGKSVKSVPSEVRNNFAEELAVFRQTLKDIEAARAAQVIRLEQSWVEDRSWTFGEWKQNFVEHPLRGQIVESLIWRIADDAVLQRLGALEDVGGKAANFEDDARVTLWHPLHSDPLQVLAWRTRIVELGITQPIKQAHREIYVLTDAERQTRTYSNRFAAHILRQHQFRALCQARGWSYDLMGGWDGWNVPTRQLPKHNLAVEYHVDVVDDGQHSDAYVSLHLASDQVRFIDARNQAVELEGIDPILFSEVLRDVDLFVAVTSVANDPGWTDGGPNGHHGGYWREWAFGELGQSAATRKELISWIAPKLSIADKLEIAEKFLIVQGKKQKYAIHFGSSNIQILPSNRYLCIVPDRAPPETASLKLPFAGDGLMSTILAKAFMLVDESKIKDETIVRQL
jgi:Domain of unknown function (DUF4132)